MPSRASRAKPTAALRIALSGTPGVGKTTVAQLAGKAGYRVVDVKAWAKAAGAIAGHDPEDEADAIDLDLLAATMLADPRATGSVMYEGHLAHLLPVDVAWVIRCDPRVLARRLSSRGYKAAKVRENLEAEALDIILQEALDSDARVIQRDGTKRTAQELLTAFEQATRRASGSAEPPDLEPVDWSDQLPIRTMAGRTADAGATGAT